MRPDNKYKLGSILKNFYKKATVKEAEDKLINDVLKTKAGKLEAFKILLEKEQISINGLSDILKEQK